MQQNHWQQKKPSLCCWQCFLQVWKPHFDTFKHSFCLKTLGQYCGQESDLFFILTIKLFSSQHLTHMAKCTIGLILKELQFWSKSLFVNNGSVHVDMKSHLCECWHWCFVIFQFMIDWSLGCSWTFSEHPKQLSFLSVGDSLDLNCLNLNTVLQNWFNKED